ncbi:MAG: prepilin-type N-terminal cleavage/methylation domain-containing protein [Planctomycetes bacterium]|nr:prepilin-type N-terminal cleavage/methylation domain-containing protein [Planctomycetota bacterium]
MRNVRSNGKNSRFGFSLVELVVVVLIVGILAAVAAPRMFNTSTKAKESATKASLSVVRNAIELYNSEQGKYPASAAALPTVLATYIKGPFPINPYNSSAAVAEGTAATANGEGWVYDKDTGNFWVNHTTNFSNW